MLTSEIKEKIDLLEEKFKNINQKTATHLEGLFGQNP